MKTGIVDKSRDVTGMPNVNILFTFYDANCSAKTINLFSVANVRAINSVSISSVLSAALDDCGKCWNEVVTLSGVSAYI